MRLDIFFEKFDRFVDAPNAVMKVRQLVLELAVQGKLVEQKLVEGDGHALLKLIHKKYPPSIIETGSELAHAEMPNFPSSWATSKLGEVAEIIRGVSFPGSAKSQTRSDGDVACLRTASVQAEIDWDDLIYISPTHVTRIDQWVAPNDIMISMANSYALVGKVAIVREAPQKATFGAFLAAIRPILIEPYFLLYVLRSPRMQAAFRASSSQTTNIANISLGRMRPLPFPLPPLAEQKRIVSKVDELMALCDRLEAQQQERESRRAVLARASLTRFSDAPTAANLSFLFHKSYDIPLADLRKSILNLAVQGKLVPQNPSDEPAEDCLTRIGIDNTLPSDDSLGLLPSSWRWVRFEDVALTAGGVTLGRKLGARKIVTLPYLRVANVKRGEIDLGVIKEVSIAEDEIERYALRSNDLLMTEGGDWDKVGRAAIWKGEIPICLHQNHVFRSRMRSDEFSPVWFERYFNSPDGRRYFESASKQTTNLASINMRQVRGCPVPIPPLAEQRRIVARVDQLMVLVDELEEQLVSSQATAEKLLDAIVGEITAHTDVALNVSVQRVNQGTAKPKIRREVVRC